MLEKRTDKYSQRKRFSTAFSMMINVITVMTLIIVMGWLILAIWFVGRGIVKPLQVRQEIHHIVKNQMESNYVIGESENNIIQYVNQLNFGSLLIHVKYLSKFKNEINNIFDILYLVTKIVIHRLWIFISSLPLLFSILFIMIVDGLGQRDIRKFQGCRESTFFFHRIKPLTSKIFYLFLLVYICMPIHILPHIVLFPMMISFAFLVMVTIKNYKKYL